VSLFDDIPLPIGTVYYDKTIDEFDAKEQKYLISCSGNAFKHYPRWLSRELVERQHGQSLMSGVETREASPGTSYNTRFFRSKA
jgi:hypothetical protein